MKMIVAIARMILVAVWHMISKEADVIDIYLKRLREQKELGEKTLKLRESVH